MVGALQEALGVSWTIPLTDVVIDRGATVDAVAECLQCGWLTMGPRTQALRGGARGVDRRARTRVAVSSGTAALHLACRGARARARRRGDRPGAHVPGHRERAALHAAPSPCCATSSRPQRPNLDPAEDVERCITPRTRAVIAVHFCGYAADLGPLRELCDARGLALVEDAAQAIGAEAEPGRQAGTVGTLGCLSFFSKKQLLRGRGRRGADRRRGARGDACGSLRSHAMTSGTWDRHRGHEDSYDVVDVGYNFRLDEPRAALGLVPAAAAARRHRAPPRGGPRYRERARRNAGLTLMWTDDDVARSSHFAFPVLFDDGETRVARARRAGDARDPDDPLPGAAHAHRARAAGRARLAARRGGGRRPPPRAAALLAPRRRDVDAWSSAVRAARQR